MQVSNPFWLKKTKLFGYGLLCAGIVVLLLPFARIYFSNIGWRWLYISLLSFCMSFCLTPVFIRVARRFQIMDRPDLRKMHGQATPLLGGVAVFLAFIVAIQANAIFAPKLKAILIGATVLCGIGIVDDIREVPAWAKLVVQLSSSALVMYFGVVLKVVPSYLGLFADIVNALLTVLWIVGITNAMNFFDGMDGLAAGLAGLVSFFLGIVAFQTSQHFIGWVSVALVGSCLGFLPYNFRFKKNAAIFLGDAGSTVLGYLLACIAVYGHWSENDPVVALVSPLLIFWIFIFDMMHITIERILTGKVGSLKEWIDYVGHDHLHHRIANVIGSPKKSVLFIYFLCFCLGVNAIVLRNATSLDALLVILQAVIMVTLITVLERRGRNLNAADYD